MINRDVLATNHAQSDFVAQPIVVCGLCPPGGCANRGLYNLSELAQVTKDDDLRHRTARRARAFYDAIPTVMTMRDARGARHFC